MRPAWNLVGVCCLAVSFAACGGSLNPNDAGAGSGGSTGAGGTGAQAGTTGTGGTGGATTTIPCSAMGACECLVASDRCTSQTEACWCPTECYPGGAIDCICGGGRFLSCADKAIAAACTAELAAVQTKCAGQAFVQDIGDLCAATRNPTCIAACLANLNSTGSCSEIDCTFCKACDCLPATRTPFANCVLGCTAVPL